MLIPRFNAILIYSGFFLDILKDLRGKMPRWGREGGWGRREEGSEREKEREKQIDRHKDRHKQTDAEIDGLID